MSLSCGNLFRKIFITAAVIPLTALALSAQQLFPEMQNTPAMRIAARAEAYLADNNPGEAIDTLVEFYSLASTEDERLQMQFLMGMASAAKEDYATAEWVFRKILKNHPSLVRVRLELGLVYFKTHKDEKADYQFRLVLGQKDLPQTVKQNILLLLSQIRYRKKWDYYINLGIAPSTNINNASSADVECLDFFGMPVCRELDKKRSSVGLSGNAGVEHNLRLNQNWRIKNTLNFSISDFAGKEYDTYGAGYSAGPLYNFRRGSAGLYAAASRLWYGGAGFQYDYGPLFNGSFDVSSRMQIGLGLSHKWQKFDDYEYMDGTTTLVMPSVYYALSSRSYILFRPYMNHLETNEKWADKLAFTYALGFGTELPLGLTFYIEPAYSVSDNKGERAFLENGTTAVKKRHDEAFMLSVRLLSRQINVYGFTPTLNYYYTHSKSNVQNASYNKNTVELGVTRRF